MMKCWKKIVISTLAVFLSTAAAVSANEDFSDVPADYWANDEITYLADEGVVGGYSNGEFRPGNEVTRSQAAIMMAASLDLDTGDRPDPEFKDINKSSHAYDAIAAAADEDIINGRNGEFMPNDPLTRGQMAAVLTRAYHLQADDAPDFADVDENDIFYHDIQALAGSNIATGYDSDNTFRPGESTTRAQFSVFTARAMNDDYKEDQGETPSLSYFEERITEAEETIERTMYEEWENEFHNDEPKASFADIEDTFLQYYTQDMTSNVWKPFYEEELDNYGPELAQAFPFRNMEGISFESKSGSEVVISGIEPETELNEQALYHEYTLIKENDSWYISDMESTPQ